MFTANLAPGQGFQKLSLWREKPGVHPSGRPLSAGYTDTGLTLFALVGDAAQKEIEAWRQNGHPITHKLVQYNAQLLAGPTDYLVSPKGRFFYIQGRREPGNLGVTVVYYAEERRGLDEQLVKPGGDCGAGGGEGDTGPAAGEGLPGVQ